MPDNILLCVAIPMIIFVPLWIDALRQELTKPSREKSKVKNDDK